MKRTKSAPSLRKRSKSRPRKKLNRTRSAPKRISTSKKKRSKKKRSKPRMLTSTSIVPRSVPQLDWRVAHPDQHLRLLKAQKNRSIVPPSVPQLDWRVAHPDQYSRIYQRSIPVQNVKLVKKKGGSKKRRKSKGKKK